MIYWLKKIDRFNFLYSIGAVIILVGVIAKFLEWEYEDELLISGLMMEIFVFATSSIQYKKKPFYYKWERIFPDLLDTKAENPQDTIAVHDRIEQVTTGYIGTLQTHIVRLDKLNYDFYKLSDQIRDSMSAIAVNAQSVSESLSKINVGTDSITQGIHEFENLGQSYSMLDAEISKLRAVTESNSGRLAQLEKELEGAGKSVKELGFQNNNGYYGIHYAETTGLLVEAIKEQQKIIQELKASMATLSAQLRQLQAELPVKKDNPGSSSKSNQ